MTQPAAPPQSEILERPWAPLIAMCIGFFMILVDMTIVTVATPDIMKEMRADSNDVLWVTSAYLLAYAVPVLITGRLGDRFGPKWLFLIGLAVFTLSSLWCGLSNDITMLITARAVQGVGAALITPQTMAVITRIFPAERRGAAMALWGATAGIATLVGPILGGVLVDLGGWEWIFFINVPVGVVALVAGWRLVPTLQTHPHKFDWIGVVLSGLGMFGLVFGIQNGEKRNWDAVDWSMIIGGVVLFVLFVLWEARNKLEPLVPLGIFKDRNFSVSNVAISAMGFAASSMGFPLMLWAQLVLGYSALKASLLMIPMAVVSFLLAPVVGKLTDKVHPRVLTSTGFLLGAIAIFLVSLPISPHPTIWKVLAPMALLGVGMAGVWAPLAATATRNLPPRQAGAGAGVYNATRMVGSVIGSAAVAVMIDSRLAAHIPGMASAGNPEAAGGGSLPAALRAPFSDAMSEVSLLPAAVLAVGFVVCLFFVTPKHLEKQAPAPAEATDTGVGDTATEPALER